MDSETMIVKHCKQCGDPFMPIRKTRLYCTQSCAQKSWNNKRPTRASAATRATRAVLCGSWGYQGKPLAGAY